MSRRVNAASILIGVLSRRSDIEPTGSDLILRHDNAWLVSSRQPDVRDGDSELIAGISAEDLLHSDEDVGRPIPELLDSEAESRKPAPVRRRAVRSTAEIPCVARC